MTGPAAVAAASHPPAASVTVAAYSRSARAGRPAFAPKMASAQAAAAARPSRYAHQRGWVACSHQPAASMTAARYSGASSER